MGRLTATLETFHFLRGKLMFIVCISLVRR
jgi:hypothetical protein